MTPSIASEVVQVSYEPHTIGPSWQRNADGSWLLPEKTLGWEIIGWCQEYLMALDEDEPWSFTPEQMRLVAHIYALEDNGRFKYRDIVVQRMKGAG